MLCSPNNRILGRGEHPFDTEAECREAVLGLVNAADRLNPVSTALGTSGHWVWRVELDGVPVAVSHRSYLRPRECQYNVGRFLAAVPTALLTDGRRLLRQAPRAVERLTRGVAENPAGAASRPRGGGLAGDQDRLMPTRAAVPPIHAATSACAVRRS
jgi:hypothetical protein